ncbi:MULTISPECIES: GtrA family protein [unclassified Nocardia]|uniref:GtrA family protein n=1 Tax=unclassified Nocardia TaxID=2637762 RepID=UPI001CE43548|nr:MULTISPECIES: GtrA family protein [unclassified Nocardia]
MAVLQAPRPSVLSTVGLLLPWGIPFPPVQTPGPASPAQAPARTPVRDFTQRTLAYLRGDRAFAQLIRFALVGGTSNIAYVLLFFAMHGIGSLTANVVGSVVSTIIANELHRQLTFHAAERVGWFTAQWEGGGLALVGLGISTAALAALDLWAPGIGGALQAVALLAITAAVGGMRFLALRGLVF